MSGSGSPAAEIVRAPGLRVAVVAASWHEPIMEGLMAGAVGACASAGASAMILRVPGTFELPLAAASCADAGYDAVVALGVVIRGGTPHFEFVCEAATSGLTRVALDSRIPVGFGVLTCDTFEQARDRAGLPGSTEDKGREAAQAAIATAVALRSIPTP